MDGKKSQEVSGRMERQGLRRFVRGRVGTEYGV